jgi:uncharacterized protein (TIGR02246 family)
MDQQDAAHHVDRIRALDEQWKVAADRHDLDGMMAIYAADAQELIPGLPPIVGRPAIRVYYQNLMDQLPHWRHQFTLHEVIVAESGDLAVTRGAYHFVPDSQHPEVAHVGKFLGVWRHWEGDWCLQINMSNEDSL